LASLLFGESLFWLAKVFAESSFWRVIFLANVLFAESSFEFAKIFAQSSFRLCGELPKSPVRTQQSFIARVFDKSLVY